MNSHIVRERTRGFRRRLRRFIRPAFLGTLRRTRPLSNDFGYDRGTPVDRYYIERFLARHRSDVRGRVLEVKEPIYTKRFGSSSRAQRRSRSRRQQPACDLGRRSRRGRRTAGRHASIASFSRRRCSTFTAEAAVRQAHRVLRPGGVLLATVPAVSRVAYRPEVAPDYWRFTAAACSKLFGETFGPDHVTVRAHGNVLTCIAFLAGMALEELRRS